jgi:hypothetical protein
VLAKPHTGDWIDEHRPRRTVFTQGSQDEGGKSMLSNSGVVWTGMHDSAGVSLAAVSYIAPMASAG